MTAGNPSNPARPLGGPGSEGWGKGKGYTSVRGKTVRRRPTAKEGDLFGMRPAANDGPIERRMVILATSQRGKAWLMRPADRDDLEPRWTPKSQLTRCPAPDEDLFIIPRWVAAERGWL